MGRGVNDSESLSNRPLRPSLAAGLRRTAPPDGLSEPWRRSPTYSSYIEFRPDRMTSGRARIRTSDLILIRNICRTAKTPVFFEV